MSSLATNESESDSDSSTDLLHPAASKKAQQVGSESEFSSTFRDKPNKRKEDRGEEEYDDGGDEGARSPSTATGNVHPTDLGRTDCSRKQPWPITYPKKTKETMVPNKNSHVAVSRKSDEKKKSLPSVAAASTDMEEKTNPGIVLSSLEGKKVASVAGEYGSPQKPNVSAPTLVLKRRNDSKSKETNVITLQKQEQKKHAKNYDKSAMAFADTLKRKVEYMEKTTAVEEDDDSGEEQEESVVSVWKEMRKKRDRKLSGNYENVVQKAPIRQQLPHKTVLPRTAAGVDLPRSKTSVNRTETGTILDIAPKQFLPIAPRKNLSEATASGGYLADTSQAQTEEDAAALMEYHRQRLWYEYQMMHQRAIYRAQGADDGETLEYATRAATVTTGGQHQWSYPSSSPNAASPTAEGTARATKGALALGHPTQSTNELVRSSIPLTASGVFQIFGRRLNLDDLIDAGQTSLYSLARSWVQDDPYRKQHDPRSYLDDDDFNVVDSSCNHGGGGGGGGSPLDSCCPIVKMHFSTPKGWPNQSVPRVSANVISSIRADGNLTPGRRNMMMFQSVEMMHQFKRQRVETYNQLQKKISVGQDLLRKRGICLPS